MNFNSVLEELDKLYEEKETKEPEQAEGEVKEEPVEEGCTKTLTEADEDEIEFAEEPVDVIPEEEEAEEVADEEIPEEDVATVKDFAKSLDEYDGKLKLEFKPIIIDGKEYSVTGIMWDDSEEGKLVAEVVFDAPEEDSVEDEGEPEDSEIEFAEEPVEEDVKVSDDETELKEYYDEEAPLGRDRPYHNNGNQGDWSHLNDKAPQWWKDQGGTDKSWTARKTSSNKWDEEAGTMWNR
jgi:hypothetical protein